jgi:FixJ family two-component response regulator
MTERAPTVFVVDDDPRVRRSMCTLLAAAGIPAESYASGAAFLAAYDPARPGCLVLDLRLRGESGLELQDELRRRKATLPIIIVTGHGTVSASVRALKSGAVEFLEKPAPPATLVARIRDALAIDESNRRRAAARTTLEKRLARLTPRERQVVDLLVTGRTSKEIAASLGLSIRTVEGYRGRIRLKTEGASVVELVRAVLTPA